MESRGARDTADAVANSAGACAASVVQASGAHGILDQLRQQVEAAAGDSAERWEEEILRNCETVEDLLASDCGGALANRVVALQSAVEELGYELIQERITAALGAKAAWRGFAEDRQQFEGFLGSLTELLQLAQREHYGIRRTKPVQNPARDARIFELRRKNPNWNWGRIALAVGLESNRANTAERAYIRHVDRKREELRRLLADIRRFATLIHESRSGAVTPERCREVLLGPNCRKKGSPAARPQ